MPSPLRIATRRSAALTVLEPVGELDVSSASQLVDLARSVAAEGDGGAVIIDLRGVTFMDSTGLRGLLFAEEACREAGRAFSVVRGGPQVERLLKVTRAAERLDMREQVDVPGA